MGKKAIQLRFVNVSGKSETFAYPGESVTYRMDSEDILRVKVLKDGSVEIIQLAPFLTLYPDWDKWKKYLKDQRG